MPNRQTALAALKNGRENMLDNTSGAEYALSVK